jgi:hypothetical protein
LNAQPRRRPADQRRAFGETRAAFDHALDQ